jgi:phenylpyruvate tautomerase PptA (4-oxalocrotonate tautomerase family)
LFRTIADNLEAVGVPRKATRMFLIEPPAENWGVGGGLLASEVAMGFKINV